MSRTTIPFATNDISALARSLREQLGDCDSTPGHVELLNILARTAGYRNFQSLRAQAAAHDLLSHPQPPPKPVDYEHVKRLLRYFDAKGMLANWPAKASLQETCVWVLWSRLPSHRTMTHDRLNRHIRANHLFGDHALLRRQLCDLGLVARTADGREYRRVERRPSAEVLALIRHLAERRSAIRSSNNDSAARRAS
jgi:hypothetical protein